MPRWGRSLRPPRPPPPRAPVRRREGGAELARAGGGTVESELTSTHPASGSDVYLNTPVL